MKYILEILFLVIPVTAIEAYSIVTHKFYFIAFIIPLVFVWVRNCMLCRARENLWVFVITFFFSLPYNKVLIDFISTKLDLGSPVLEKLFLLILFIWLICTEEIINGVIGRFIFKKQAAVGTI